MPYMQYQMPGQGGGGPDIMQMLMLQQMMQTQGQPQGQPQGGGGGLGSLLGAMGGGSGGGYFGAGQGGGMGIPGLWSLGGGSSSSLSAPSVFSASRVPGMGAPEIVSGAHVPSELGAFSFDGIGAAGNAFLPIAGGLGAYDLFKNKRTGGRGALQGAASGAALGSFFGPVGAGIGGVLGLGAGLFGHKKPKPTELSRWETVGRPEMYNKEGYHYGEGNADFMRTGNAQFLSPDDIRVNPDNYHNVEDWDKWSRSNQDSFLNQMLKGGHVSTNSGGVYYDDAFATNLANQIRSGQAPGGAADPMIPKRSRTSSPGISLEGKRISY